MKETSKLPSLTWQEQEGRESTLKKKVQNSKEKLFFHKKQLICFIVSLYGVCNISEHVCTEGI